MAERGSLLRSCPGQPGPWVRIPPSPIDRHLYMTFKMQVATSYQDILIADAARDGKIRLTISTPLPIAGSPRT